MNPKSMNPKSKERIDTQIHRRRAAPASGAMKAEWDISEGQPPVRLRMTDASSLLRDGRMVIGGNEDGEEKKSSQAGQEP